MQRLASRRRRALCVIVVKLLTIAVVAASALPASAQSSSDDTSAAVSLLCPEAVSEGDGSVRCELVGYTGEEPSASLSVSSLHATAVWRAHSVLPDPQVYFVADESGEGGVWVVSVIVFDNLSCNAPTTVELAVIASGVSYGASIQILDTNGVSVCKPTSP